MSNILHTNYINSEVFVEFGHYPSSDEYYAFKPIKWKAFSFNDGILGLIHWGVYDYNSFAFFDKVSSWTNSYLFDALQRKFIGEIFTAAELSVLYPIEQCIDARTPYFNTKNYVTIPTKLELETLPSFFYNSCNPHTIWTRTMGEPYGVWVYEVNNEEKKRHFILESDLNKNFFTLPIIYVDFYEMCNDKNIKFKIFNDINN